MRSGILVLALSSLAPTTFSNAGGCGGGGGNDDPPTTTPEYADQNTAGTRFSDIANIASGTQPCPTNYAQVEGCYNLVNPPTPSVRRSFIPASATTPGAVPFGRSDAVAMPGQTQLLPNHRSTVDGRLVTLDSRTMAAFRPEALGYGMQGTTTKSLRGAQGGFYYSTMIDPRPGKSRLPATSLSKLTGPPNGWDICNSDGAGSTGARACTATLVNAAGQDVDASGECYDITPVWAWESDNYWDLRSAALTAFVPAAKELAASETGEVLFFPRTAASYVGKQRDYSAFFYSACDTKYGPLYGNCDWGINRFFAEVTADCTAGNNQPWCQLLNSQKSAVGNYTFFTAPGQSHSWAGRNQSTPDSHHAFLEPATTADGRLLIIHDYRQGIMYSYADTPCDASKWTTFKPISMAFTDPAVNTRYGFAKFPMRRFDGSMVPAGETIPGGYPWIDRRGDNLMFPMFPTQKRAWNGTAEATGATWNHDTFGATNSPGVVAVGAWTKGKLILLDNAVSATDWGTPAWEQRNDIFGLRLYREGTVRFRPQGISLLSSLENQFNHIEALNPSTPRDVVWLMSSAAQRTAEVAFDDYLQSRVLIAAPMNVEMTHESYTELVAGNYTNTLYTPHNGFTRITTNGTSKWNWPWQFTAAPIMLQNASTTVNPASLRLRGGAWINPIAEGGVQGRGIYLDGYNDHIAASEVPVVDNFYLGLWVDVRTAGWTASKPSRKLYEFPDGSAIELSTERVTFRTGTSAKTVDVNVPQGSYTHVGIALAGDTQRIATVFINGTKVGEVALDGISSLFRLGSGAAGSLVIGSSGSGALPLGAWIDEFRLLSLEGAGPTPTFFEEACNQALGSLRRAGASFTCEQINFRQNDVLDAAGADKGLEFPLAAYTTRNCGSTVHGNAPAACARGEALGLDQKQLVANSQRPDFSGVAFCVTCHNSAVSPVKGLLPAALLAGTQPAKLDLRRQPMQWPRAMSGYAPSKHGSAVAPYTASGNGAMTRMLDEYFLGANASTPPTKVAPPSVQ
ncbi:MAG: hypothetical protein IPL79_10580 [Myxococcales bacterium]|nr:hypothetical protein [Myxococcales bacterium]